MVPADQPIEPAAYLKLYEKHHLVFIAPPLGHRPYIGWKSSGESRPAFSLRAGGSRLGQRLDVIGDQIDVLVTSKDSEGKMAAFATFTDPNTGPPLHSHSQEDEFFYVLDGEMEFEVDGRQLVLSGGDCALSPRDTAHTFRNIGQRRARMVVVAFPGGMDQFLAELAAAVPSGIEPTSERILPPARKFGIRFLGPPLALRG